MKGGKGRAGGVCVFVVVRVGGWIRSIHRLLTGCLPPFRFYTHSPILPPFTTQTPQDLIRLTPGQLTVALPPTAAIDAMERQRAKQQRQAARSARALPAALTPKASGGGGGVTPKGGGVTPRGGGGGGGSYTPRGTYTPSPRSGNSGNGYTPSPRHGAHSPAAAAAGFEPSAGLVMMGRDHSGLGPSSRPRLAPIPSFSACALEASLPQGTALTLSLFALHRHPALYETPHAFRPERWIARHASGAASAMSWRCEPTALSFGDGGSNGSSNGGSLGGGRGSSSSSSSSNGGGGGGEKSGWAAMLVEYEEDGATPAFPQQMIQLQVLTALLMLLQKYRIEPVRSAASASSSKAAEEEAWGEEEEEDIDAIIRERVVKKVRLVPRVNGKD